MVNDISQGLSEYETIDIQGTRGEQLEEVLTTACHAIAKAGKITDNNADLDFMLMVVGSYLISKSKGVLADDVKPPSSIFDDSFFDMLDKSNVTVEEIEDE